MKPIDIPAGLHAVYTYDEVKGWTCCSLVDKSFKVVAAGLARYNPKDFNDPAHPFDPQLGCHIALGRAVKQYEKNSNTKSTVTVEFHKAIGDMLHARMD